MTRPLYALGIGEMTAGFAAGAFSPVAVMQTLFDAIEQDSHGIDPFVHLDRPGALAAAVASEQRWRQGASLGPLDGVPVSIKDMTHVAGWPTRRGSLATASDPVPTQDAPAVQRLREGGAVLFGKTSTSEFGWAVISENPHHGTTRNPHHLGHTAGGSSSGAAAHVAMGWGPLALGSDAGGSVRIPASYTGLVALKPTFSAIPQPPQSAFSDFAHLGPMVRSVADCRAAMQVLSFADPRDPASMFPRGPAPGALAGRTPRIGWATRFGRQALLDPEIETRFRGFIGQLGGAGLAPREIALDWLDTADEAWTLWATRIHESFFEWPAERRALLDPRLLRVHDQGGAVDMGELSRCRSRVREMANRIAALFCEIDFLLTPATSTPAPALGRLAAAEHPLADEIEHRTGNWFAASPYSYPFNVTQQPGLSLPLGKTAAGLPFGLQAIGQKYADDALLDFAARIEPLLATGGPFAPALAPHLS